MTRAVLVDAALALQVPAYVGDDRALIVDPGGEPIGRDERAHGY
jgi:hypothetical protein